MTKIYYQDNLEILILKILVFIIQNILCVCILRDHVRTLMMLINQIFKNKKFNYNI